MKGVNCSEPTFLRSDWFERTIANGTKGTQNSYNDVPQQDSGKNSHEGEVTFEHIGVYPKRAELGRAGVPGCVYFAPGGREVSYLQAPEGGLTRSAFLCDISTGNVRELCKPPSGVGEESTFSLEEKLRRERQRQLHTGITSYAWAQSADVLLVPIGDSLFVQRGFSGSLIRVFDPKCLPANSIIDARLSADGNFVCFVCEKEVYMCCTGPALRESVSPSMDHSMNEAVPFQLTTGARARNGTTHGVANFIAQEEMDRYEGYWLSPSSELLAFEEVDESSIPEFRIMHLGQNGVGKKYEENHHYPFAGAQNPKVRLGVIRTKKSSNHEQQSDAESITWIDYSSTFNVSDVAECYLARVQWIKLGCDQSIGRESLLLQVENRAQTCLHLLLVNLVNNHDVSKPMAVSIRRLLIENSSVWINLHNMLIPVSPSVDVLARASKEKVSSKQEKTIQFWEEPVFIWASERSGFMHLYLYRGDQCLRQLTCGEWVVEKVCGVDSRKGCVYFTGNKGNCLERHLFVVPFSFEADGAVVRGGDGAFCRGSHRSRRGESSTAKQRRLQDLTDVMEPRQITSIPGMHDVVVNIENGMFIDIYSSSSLPFRAAVCSLADGAVVRQFYKNCDPVLRELKISLQPPEFFTIQSSPYRMKERVKIHSQSPTPREEGDVGTERFRDFPSVTLHCCMYKPNPSIFGQGPYPLIVSIYGGPHVQRVQNSWGATADLRARYFSTRGYLVMRCDSRGSFRRGLAFEAPLKWDMGNIELEDQVKAVKHLVDLGLADPKRVGIYGWSYGGYLSAMALAKYPTVFKAAVAGAPVTSWDGYDTHYTERYMGSPQENPLGYTESSVMTHCTNIEGSLLLVHGLVDENVHFRHTARLICGLISAQKHYELLLFPNERHQPRRMEDKIFMEKRVFNFFQRCL
eukprot:g5657.t1